MDMRTFEQKVRDLSDKLKKQGIARSDAQAKMMAEDILRTEREQLKKFEQKAHDPTVNPQQRKPAVQDRATAQNSQAFGTALQTVRGHFEKAQEPQKEQPQQQAPVRQPAPPVTLEPRRPAAPVQRPIPQQIHRPVETGPATPIPQPQVKESEEQPKPAPQQSPEKKPEPPKVDLSVMFNYAKRK